MWIVMLMHQLLNPTHARAVALSTSPLFELEPTQILTGAFYHGQYVNVRASVPSDKTGIAILCVGPVQDISLMEKGRVMGLWMNVKELHVSGFPSFYLLLATRSLEEIASAPVREDYMLGYRALQTRWEKEGPDPSERDRFIDFLKLKQKDELYRIVAREGAISVKAGKGNYQEIAAQIWIPAKAIPGEYKVTLLCLKKGRPFLTKEQAFEVVKAGLPAFIARNAEKRGLEYGIVAVILATLSGLAIGLIFSSKAGH